MNARCSKIGNISFVVRSIASVVATVLFLAPYGPTFGQQTPDEFFDPAPQENSQPARPATAATPAIQPAQAVPPTPARQRGTGQPRTQQQLPLESQLEALRTQSEQLASERARLEDQLRRLQVERELQRSRSTPLPEDAALQVFQLQTMQPRDVAAALVQVLGDDELRVSADLPANVLIVRGKEATVAKATELIRALEVAGLPRPTPDEITMLQLRLYWFAGGLPEGVGIDPDLRTFSPQAYEAVTKLGFKDPPRIICQHVASVAKRRNELAGFKFQVPVDIAGRVVEFRGGGSVRGFGRYELDLNVEASIEVPPPPGPPGDPRLFKITSVSGSVALPSQHYVVMGTSNLVLPGQTTKSYPSAFVVYLEEANIYGADSGRGTPRND